MVPKDKPPACRGCPAYEWGVGFVEPEGPQGANLCLVGQGPGEMEAKFSRPFFPNAPSGHTLMTWLHKAEMSRGDVLLTNLVWCWLPEAKPNGSPRGNRAPTEAETSYCTRTHLRPLLERAGLLEEGPRVIVAVGAPALAHLQEISHGTDKQIGTFKQRDLGSLGR